MIYSMPQNRFLRVINFHSPTFKRTLTIIRNYGLGEPNTGEAVLQWALIGQNSLAAEDSTVQKHQRPL